MDTSTADQWVGRTVAVYPSDTYVRHALVIGVDNVGWELEITGSGYTGDKYGYRPGDRLYVSHSARLTLAEIEA